MSLIKASENITDHRDDIENIVDCVEDSKLRCILWNLFFTNEDAQGNYFVMWLCIILKYNFPELGREKMSSFIHHIIRTSPLRSRAAQLFLKCSQFRPNCSGSMSSQAKKKKKRFISSLNMSSACV